MTDGTRGQLVLLAAALVVTALVPMTLAYQQLAYQPDVQADEPRPAGDGARSVLQRGVTNASVAVDGIEWEAHESASERVHDRLNRSIRALERPRPATGRTVRIDYNATAADAWPTRNCPYGPNRRFGGCIAFDGVVLQERADTVVLVAVVVDVRVRSTTETTTMTLVLRP